METRNYVIGYGSLMNISSLRRTLPQVTYIEPIYLSNYTRSWNAIENQKHSLSTTYLGVNREKNKKINCIIFEVSESLLDTLDLREFLYTRESVNITDIEFIKSQINPTTNDKVWIYVTKNPQKPNSHFPIIQSYVDVCISGCLELENQFSIQNFANTFVTTTQNWSKHWVNDRIFPRAPHIHQPFAYMIDEILHNEIPNYFKEITIE